METNTYKNNHLVGKSSRFGVLTLHLHYFVLFRRRSIARRTFSPRAGRMPLSNLFPLPLLLPLGPRPFAVGISCRGGRSRGRRGLCRRCLAVGSIGDPCCRLLVVIFGYRRLGRRDALAKRSHEVGMRHGAPMFLVEAFFEGFEAVDITGAAFDEGLREKSLSGSFSMRVISNRPAPVLSYLDPGDLKRLCQLIIDDGGYKGAVFTLFAGRCIQRKWGWCLMLRLSVGILGLSASLSHPYKSS
jgi:hypothetical protein